jgi:NitT/TauT family transport system substrate-binding protein
MKSFILLRWLVACVAIVALKGFIATAGAEEIAIAQYGSSTSAMPWAVALEKDFFKEAGVDITAIRASAGGSADIRNMIAGGLPYAESALASVITASRSGADVRIVSENIDTVANFVWATMPNSPIKSLSDLKGRRLTFTTPQSTSEVMNHLLVAKLGMHNDDVRYVATGPYGAALTALQAGGADVALLAEPIFTLNKGKYQELAWARDALPPLVSTVGVVPAEFGRKHPEVIKGILLARRRAVEFMKNDRQESAEIIARVYKLDAAIVRTVLTGLIDHPSAGGVPYFGQGAFVPDGIDRLMTGLKLINALDIDTGWRPLVDQSFLPPDLQRKL